MEIFLALSLWICLSQDVTVLATRKNMFTMYDADPRVRKDLECAWWYQYKVQCFNSLIPTRKWNIVKRNICVDDVVLIQYSSKSSPGTYHLGRIINTELEVDGVVQTCTAKYVLCNGDSSSKAVQKGICSPVQRLVLIIPVEEQNWAMKDLCKNIIHEMRDFILMNVVVGVWLNIDLYIVL